VQRTHDGKLIAFVKNVPAKGYKLFPYATKDNERTVNNACKNPVNAEISHLHNQTGLPEANKGGGISSGKFEIANNRIETPHFTVAFDGNGRFTSVYDKAARREVLKPGGFGNRLVVYEDKPMDYDNWDIDIYYTEKSWECEKPTEIRWLEEGPIRGALLIRRTFLQSEIEQKIYFYADIPRIDFDTRVDWKQQQCLLKTEFDVAVNAAEATYDIQFGNIKRPTHANTSWDAARFEVCGHKYADISEGAFGAALLNDCKYGYGIQDGKMTLSLIKSGTVPNPTTDQEEHFFIYSFMPHANGFAESDVVNQAYQLNVPLRAIPGRREAAALEEAQLMRGTGWVSIHAAASDGITNPCAAASANSKNPGAAHIALETIKKSYDGERVIIRLFEYRNIQSDITLSFNTPVKEVYETDLMENRLSPVSLNKISGPDASATRTDAITVKPFEIKTFEIERMPGWV
jgi:alpha-mannosidase